MSCDVVHTGNQFLSATLAHLDCQGRTIGSYGYGALADPSSTVALCLTGLLTIFIALFGVRLLAGHRPGTGDLMFDILKVGVFLTLATSWPAWRTLGYDLVMDGPLEIAQDIGIASGLPGSSSDLAARLQDADDGIVVLTQYGSGRLTGGILADGAVSEAVRSIALDDQRALGSGRATFLATIIGTFGLLRLGSGLLLAMAPVMAGLVLFTGTLPLFHGWLRGLAFCALGSLAFQIIAASELALLFPWLQDVLTQREVNTFTPSAPTELFVLMLAFAAMTAGALLLLARITFLPAIFVRQFRTREADARPSSTRQQAAGLANEGTVSNRAMVIAGAVATSVARTNGTDPSRVWDDRRNGNDQASQSTTQEHPAGRGQAERLGNSWRRSTRRVTATGRKRDEA